MNWLAAWQGLIFAGIAGISAYHFWRGYRTGVVRLPVSVLTVQQFESDQSRAFFWAIMVVNMLISAVALVVAGSIIWSALTPFRKPIDQLQSLNGCYEGEGLPDFMRPPRHWAFRATDGVIFDRNGRTVSRIQLAGSTAEATSLRFSPGILIADDEQKRMMVYPGPTITASAYSSGSRITIAFTDDRGDVMHTTSCD